MKEAALRIKVRKHYEDQGYVVWFPAKVKYHQTDIFGIWDGVAWKEADFIFFQMTTISNKADRLAKITEYMEEHNLHTCLPYVSGQVICWDKKRRELRVFEINF